MRNLIFFFLLISFCAFSQKTPATLISENDATTYSAPFRIRNAFNDQILSNVNQRVPVFLDSADITKRIKWFLNGSHPTATTYNLTLPNGSGTLARTSDLSGWLTGTLTDEINVSKVRTFNSGNSQDSVIYIVKDGGSEFRYYLDDVNNTGLGDREAQFIIDLQSDNIGSTSAYYRLRWRTFNTPAFGTQYFDIHSDPFVSYIENNSGYGLRLHQTAFTGDNRLNAPNSEIGIYLGNSDGHLGLANTEYLNWDATGIRFQFGSDATGDIPYRNSSGYLTRLPIGTSGQVLTVSGGGLPSWATPSGGSSVLSDITAATGANTINSGANHQIWDWNSLTSGTGMSFRSSSTGAASNTLKVVSIEKSGANATSTQTTTALNVSNTSTGTTSTNVGGYFAASGGTTNISLHSVGETVLETTAANPHVNIRSSSGADWLRFINTRYLAFYPTVNANLRITPSSSALGLEFMTPGSSVNLANRFAFTWSGAVTGTTGGPDILIVSGENQGGTKVGATLSSGTKNFGLFKASGAWNFTGSYSGTLIGYDYDPTITSGTGLTNLSFRATSGDMLVPASSYIGFGTTPNDYGFRDNAGTMEFKNSGGSWAAFGGGSYTFTNGLTESGGTAKLGGEFTENTTITGDFQFNLGNSGSRIDYFQAYTDNAIVLNSSSMSLDAGSSGLSLTAGAGINLDSGTDGVYVANSTISGATANGVHFGGTDVESSSEFFVKSESGAVVNISGLLTPSVESGTSFTLDEGDRAQGKYTSNGSAVTVTVPSTLPIGYVTTIMQEGAGTVSLSAGANVNIAGKTSTTGANDFIWLWLYKKDGGTSYYVGR